MWTTRFVQGGTTYLRLGFSAIKTVLARMKCCVAVTSPSEAYQTSGNTSPLDLSASRLRTGVNWLQQSVCSASSWALSLSDAGQVSGLGLHGHSCAQHSQCVTYPIPGHSCRRSSTWPPGMYAG